ncbi:TonB-dependent siderophore receptor [Henriciella aquimarina]|uniref:TonB-dependent siderophore receptor n=1 Tax=Henriciella aquimarina TaxID=545261 RepID=UPI001301D78F|nr:TonB-dependent siderophore receptor [Henriciella aquimarina]
MSMTCALAFQASGVAQEADEAAASQDEEAAMDTVFVTGTRAVAATKTLTPLTEVPQSISVITDDEFRERAAVDLQDVYRYSAGVAPAQSVDSRGDFVNARGFEAAQYLDGLKRMPDFIYGARLENYTLERAEVLRGPSSVLYGAGGPGGVLNGASKTPKFEYGGEAGVVVGTDSRLQFQGDITGPLTDQLAGRLVVLARDGETQWGTPDDRVLINPSLTWAPGPDTEITLIGLYQEDQNGSLGYVPLSKSINAGSEAEKVDFNFYQGEPGFNGMDTTYTSGSLLVTHKFAPNITFRSASRYSDMDSDYKEIYGDFSDGVTPFADPEETLLQREFYVNDEQSEVINTDNNVLVELTTGAFEHEVLVGVDYIWFDQSKAEGFSCDGFEGLFGCYVGGSPPPIDIYNPQPGGDIDYGYTNFLEYNSSQLGFYAQDQITYNDWLHVLLGVRHDTAESERNGVDELDQDQVSFRGGVIADVTETLSPYFSYSESFLPVPGGDFFGNPFEPRTARQYEVGAKWEPQSGMLFTLALFDIEESNYVSQDPENIQNFLQGGEVGSQGVELEAVIRMPEDFDFMASYSYTEAEVLSSSQSLAEGDRIADIPEHLASVWTTKSFQLDNGWTLRAGGGVRYIGDKIDTAQAFVTPSVTLVDAMVSASYGNWLVSVNSSNLLNEKYYATCGLSSAPYGYCVAAKDRTVLASVTRRF